MGVQGQHDTVPPLWGCATNSVWALEPTLYITNTPGGDRIFEKILKPHKNQIWGPFIYTLEHTLVVFKHRVKTTTGVH